MYTPNTLYCHGTTLKHPLSRSPSPVVVNTPRKVDNDDVYFQTIAFEASSLNCCDEVSGTRVSIKVRRTHGGAQSFCSPGVSQGPRGCLARPLHPAAAAQAWCSRIYSRAHLTTAPSRPPQEAPHLPAAWQLVSTVVLVQEK